MRDLTATEHRELASAAGDGPNRELHLLVVDLLDAGLQAVLLVNHWRRLRPVNEISGDAWVDAVEVAMIETRIAKFDAALAGIGPFATDGKWQDLMQGF